MPRVKECATTLAILAFVSATLTLAEDFKTVTGKEYKDATIIRVEPDGIVLKTKAGISKVYFVELPNDVRHRFHPTPAKTVAAPRHTPELVKSKEKQDAPRQTGGGVVAAMANSAAVIKYFVAGITIIAGVVFLVVRRRSQ